jgi:exosortase
LKYPVTPESKFTWASLPAIYRAQLAVLLGMVAVIIWDQSHWWLNREDYGFGFLVPLFVGFVLYERQLTILQYFSGEAASDHASSVSPLSRLLEWLALLGACASMVLFVMGGLLRAVSGPANPSSLALAAGFAGFLLCSVFLYAQSTFSGALPSLQRRIAMTALFVFPAFIWLLSAPLVSVLESRIKVFLLTQVTIIVSSLLNFLGYEIIREGNVLLLPNGSVGVEEACSGIRSLTACLFAGSFLAASYVRLVWKKLLLVFFAMCLAFLTNLLRSFILTLCAYYQGSEVIDAPLVLPLIGDVGTLHDVTGLAILGLTTLGLIILLPIINFSFKEYFDARQ